MLCWGLRTHETIRHGPYLPWRSSGAVVLLLGNQGNKVTLGLGFNLLGPM